MAAHSETRWVRTSHPWRLTAKRTIDVVASAVGLTLLIPLFIVIAIAIWIDDGGPVLYRQTRIGRMGRPFEIDKFRTMRPAIASAQSNLTVAGDPRVTRIGSFLRKTKIDELPQLFNVLRGEMSLVGPRPETPDLIVHYTPPQRALMLSVRPGMTDYASLLFRDEGVILARASDPARLYRERIMPLKYELCVRYLSEIGPSTDFRIIFATIWGVVFPSAWIRLVDRALASRIENMVCNQQQ
jgi:lipopolysaccharide/colanic/teichoic acid biosynthesis glycosyltransferase